MLRIVAGLLRPRAGVVRCGARRGSTPRAASTSRPSGAACGCLFQDYALFPHLHGWQNVAYPLRRRRDGAARARGRAARALRGRAPRAARARASSPAASASAWRSPAPSRATAVVLLLDEPLSALDARDARRRRPRADGDARRERRPRRCVVTHDFAEAALLADRVAVIDHGRIVQHGTPSELAAAPGVRVRGGLHRRPCCRPRGAAPGGLTRVTLEGGGGALSR